MYVDVPALVSPDLAQTAQAMLTRNRVMARRNTKHDYLLGGALLRCGALLPDGQPCHSTMHGEGGSHYRCSHVARVGLRRHSVPARAVETTVWAALRATLTDTSTVLDDIKALADQSSAQAAQAEAEIRATERAIEEIDGQRDTLLDLHLNGRLDADRFSAKDAALQERQQRLADQHAALAARRNAALAQQLPIAEIEDLCRRLAGRVDNLTFSQRQRLVRTLLTDVTADRKTVHLEGAFDALSMTVALEEEASESAIVTTTS
jgi:hypothetical protein